ncbi:MAG: DUF3021 domain-containing protein [Arcanobacterium sp.]|nr:DUF3021 domain-containing protein [Arcanobacterium sp.]
MKIKDIVATTVVGACIGITIGTSVELLFSALYSSSFSPGTSAFLEGFANVHVGVLIERIVYAVYGVICAFAGLLYRNETRPITLTSAIHFAIVLICGIAAGSYLKWWSGGIEMFGVIAMFVVVYLVIWLITWLIERTEVAKMNEKLQ